MAQNSVEKGGGVSYIDARTKRFRDAVRACAFLRKNFRNGVPARSVTKKYCNRKRENVTCDHE
jgi:hypothetical protein